MYNLETHVPISLNIQPKLKTYTLAEYLRKEAKSEDKYEFINGNLIKTPPKNGSHNIISANVIASIGTSFEYLNNNYILFSSKQKVYCPNLNDCVYADALAVCEKPLYWDDELLLLINPIIIVEVLSKSTQKYDRSGKFDKYKTLESFKEYVLIRQSECYAEVWYQKERGLWQETVIQDINGELPLQSVGITIPMKNVYEDIEL